MNLPAHVWGESYRPAQHAGVSAAAWQRQLGARWDAEEVWQACGAQVRLPPRGALPIVATRACTSAGLRPLLRQLRHAHRRALIRYAAEGNRKWHATAAMFRRRWASAARQIHASGFLTAWTVSGQGCRSGAAWRYYPGRRYADAVGWSEFAWDSRSSWQATAGACYPQMHRQHRPIVLPEIGVSARMSSHARVAWLRQARAWCASHNVRGVVYLDTRPDDGTGDWRLSGAAKAAWGEWGRSER